MMIDEKLNSMGVKLSDPVPSVGSFIPVVITGNLAFVSGQIPVEPDSKPIQAKYKGKVGRDLSLKDGQLCVINGLSELKRVVGSLDKIKKL